LFVIIVIYACFIDILLGSVEMHLRCGGMCNNYIIATAECDSERVLKSGQ